MRFVEDLARGLAADASGPFLSPHATPSRRRVLGDPAPRHVLFGEHDLQPLLEVVGRDAVPVRRHATPFFSLARFTRLEDGAWLTMPWVFSMSRCGSR
jgi:hypothetical protein